MTYSRRGFLKAGLAAAAAGCDLDFGMNSDGHLFALSGSPDQVVAGPELITVTGRLQAGSTLKSGKLMGWWVESDAKVQEAIANSDSVNKAMARYSSDDGQTWSAPELLFEFPKGFGAYLHGPWFVDQKGIIHLFGLHYLGCGPGGDANWESCKCYLFHVMSTDEGKTWGSVQQCDFGHEYTGATNSVIQLKSGRIAAPVSYLSGRMTGKFVTNLTLSDDAGKTWRPSKGDCVVDTGGQLTESGACEPICIELKDGRLWMLMRTQAGYQYEAFSSDGGDTWTEPTPSRFVSSNSPGAFLRLRDGRLVLAWNNCMGAENREGIMCSYDRQILAAAISADDGKTWKGYREIGRIGEGARQISYITLTESMDGSILCSGLADVGYFPQGVIRLHPDWLTESEFRDGFKHGLANWVTFGCEGVTAAPHPERSGDNVLVLRKPKADVPAAGSLNFPFGTRGRLQIRLNQKVTHEFARPHYYLGLADFFCLPRLPQHPANKTAGWGIFPAEGRFTLRIAPDGQLAIASDRGLFQTEFSPTRTRLDQGHWHTLTLEWDCSKSTCALIVDGRHAADIPQLGRAKGVCYLRLWATAEVLDYSGLLVESVECAVKA